MACKAYSKGFLVRQQNIKGLFFKKILEMIQSDPRICFVASDALMERSIMRKAMSLYPDRIIDVGIAEQNLIGVASGLALSGKLPFVSAMAPFLPLRALDQIHTDIAYNDVPVKLISVSGGTTNGGGPTHNLICDFGIMNTIPNMTILVPCDTTQFLSAIEKTVDYVKPVYLRMPRPEDPAVYMDSAAFNIGIAAEVHAGNDATIIATGRCVYQGLLAARHMDEENVHVRVLDMHTIKPLDKNSIRKAATETGRIIVVEDHNVQGGMGMLISAAIAEAGITCKIIKLGIPDEFSILGSADDIASYYGFDAATIIKTIHQQIL
ncbi:MAG: hypothetical protein GX825_09460 [Syntrophomonadaceae bacterium]|nr:hypothetical protein [Syntrophomonadaceae bacterium]